MSDPDVKDNVTELIRCDPCASKCLQGKAGALEHLLCSVSQMTHSEKATNLLILIAVLMKTETAERRRGHGVREKFHYYLLFLGRVCRASFSACYGVQALTVRRHKERIREGNISAKAHEAVDAAAAFADTVHVTRDSDIFRDYKPAVTELYKNVEVLSKFQIFVKDANTPGVVECKISPDGDSVSQDLRRQIDGILTTKEKVIRMLRPHVPTEFRDDPMYAAPSEGQMEASKTTKNVRRAHHAALAVAAKRNQDERWALGEAPQPKKARTDATGSDSKQKEGVARGMQFDADVHPLVSSAMMLM
ncbi:TPA: hypothetical protein N0F65_007581 [Lagenidium giganteum]|uniref:Uncharacterized protein n=1 Tax=Lagenidium giganteum TaxID=4803 RepID=A0AAV2ZNJ6_9STRA|nr:TPA: hypothetical protein N0F65_007581 [Lagenidium giganteum]